MKRFLSLVLALATLFALAGCGEKAGKTAVPEQESAVPAAELVSETEITETEELPARPFPGRQENSAVPDVFSIASDAFPVRYDLTEEERTALWEMLCAAEYTPVTFDSIADKIEPYSDEYALNGSYEGYYRISWYCEGAESFGSAQLWPGDLIGVGEWYRYDADSFDAELLRALCDVPQTIYPQTGDDIRAASAALKADQESKGNVVREIRYDEQLCSAFMDAILHAGPAGQRTGAKAEDTIVLLLDSADGPDAKSEYAVLHRTKDGGWEVIGRYPVPAA